MAIKFGRPLERKIGFVPAAAEASEVARNPLDLTVRMRRNRRTTGRAAWCASTCSPPTT